MATDHTTIAGFPKVEDGTANWNVLGLRALADDLDTKLTLTSADDPNTASQAGHWPGQLNIRTGNETLWFVSATGATATESTWNEVQTASGSIAANSIIGTVHIAPNTVSAAQLATGAVGSEHIQDGTVTTADLADRSVTTVKIALNTISSANVATGVINSEHLAAGSGIAKVIGHIDSTTVKGGLGITSVAKASTGQHDITLSTAFTSTDFVVALGGDHAGGTQRIPTEVTSSRTTTNIRIITTFASSSVEVESPFSIAAWGDQ